MARKKLVSLTEAIGIIRDGDVLFLGSLIECRRPMAAAYEIVRQQRSSGDHAFCRGSSGITAWSR